MASRGNTQTETAKPEPGFVPVIFGLSKVGLTFILYAPIPVIGIFPYLITRWVAQPPFFGIEALRYIGLALLPIGLTVHVGGLLQLARGGANPIPPVYSIVKDGLFAWTRNPMYIGALTTVLGEALFFGSRGLLYYIVAVLAVAHTFEVTYDEPELRKKFGKEYEDYCASVNRWLPRPPRRR